MPYAHPADLMWKFPESQSPDHIIEIENIIGVQQSDLSAQPSFFRQVYRTSQYMKCHACPYPDAPAVPRPEKPGTLKPGQFSLKGPGKIPWDLPVGSFTQEDFFYLPTGYGVVIREV